MKIHSNKLNNLFSLLINIIIENYLIIVLVIVAILSLLFELNGFPKNLAYQTQTSLLSQPPSWKQLFLDPSNLIIKIVFKMINSLFYKNYYLIKIFFSLLVFLSFLLIFKILKNWYGTLIAFFGGLLYISSFWILESARLIGYSPEFLLLVPIILIIKNYLTNKNLKLSGIYSTLIALMIIFFIPGAIFYILGLIILSFKNLKYHLRKIKLIHKIILLMIIFLFTVYNLVLSLKNYQFLLKILALYKMNLNFDRLFELVKIFITSPNTKSIFVSSQPLVGILITIMFLLGLSYFIKNLGHSNRSQTIILFLIFTILLTTINFTNNLSILIDLIYLTALTGLAYFVQIWLKAFPYNKFARIGGYSLVTLAILISVFFGYRQFFVAYKYSHNNQTSSLINQS